MYFPYEIVLRSVIVYIFIVLAIKLFGKKELSQLSIIDLVMILLLSNAVQNAMVGPDTSLLGGITAALALFATNYLLKVFLFKDKRVNQWLEGSPIMLVHNGKVIKENLDKLKISMEEIEQAAREHGVESIGDVDLSILEIDGNISILSHSYQRQSKRKRISHKSLLV